MGLKLVPKTTLAGAVVLLTELLRRFPEVDKPADVGARASAAAAPPTPSFRMAGSAEMFKYIAFTFDFYEKQAVHRYAVLKAMLNFLTVHSLLLRRYFKPRAEDMLEWLLRVCKHKTRDVRHCAWDALDSFLQALSEDLQSTAEGGTAADKSDQERSDLVGAFVNRFRAILAELGQLRLYER